MVHTLVSGAYDIEADAAGGGLVTTSDDSAKTTVVVRSANTQTILQRITIPPFRTPSVRQESIAELRRALRRNALLNKSCIPHVFAMTSFETVQNPETAVI